MFSAKSKRTLVLVLSLLIVLAGLGYLLYLHLVFPGLVPHYGSGESFTLTESENFTVQMPWSANTRLHLTLQADDIVQLYLDGVFECDCTSYDLVVEPDEQLIVSLKSDAEVSGMFTARQEVPSENQLLALILIAVGLLSAGAVLSEKIW